MRFWFNEHKWPLKFSSSITESLDGLDISYEMDTVDGVVDMSECFKDGFDKPHHKYLLEFVTHTKLERYPPVIAQTCIDYLSSVAKGKPEQHMVPRTTAVIICYNQR